jgi:hypothetical protein
MKITVLLSSSFNKRRDILHTRENISKLRHCIMMFLVGFTILSISRLYSCPKSLELMGILIIFSYFYLHVKVKGYKRLKMALTLDERVEIMLLSGPQGWTQRQVADEFNARHPELQTLVLLSIPIC